MNLVRIQYFVEVAKCENMSEAARKLFTSQPNLSKQIALMEQELGFSLFLRTGHTLRLTQAGQYLYDQFKELPEYTAQAIAHAHALSRGDMGSLFIGILEGQDINSVLTGRFDQMREKYPGIVIEMERNSFSHLRKWLQQCRYDVIITLSFELRNAKGLCSEVILPQRGAIAISKQHPLAAKEDLQVSDLSEAQFVAISPEESPGGYAQLFEQCALFGFEPKIARIASTLESMLLCVEAGIGVALLDCNTRLEHNEQVRTIPIPESACTDVVAVWKEEDRNPLIRQVVECLKEPRRT